MESARFDQWAKAIAAGRATRRRFLGVLGAGGVVAMTVAPAVTPAAVARDAQDTVGGGACRRNGRPCLQSRSGDCCSGRCVGRRGIGRCKAVPSAEGCTVRDNSCRRTPIRCPQDPVGICYVLQTGRPFCARDSACFACDTNEDCQRRFNRRGGRCVRCGDCGRTNGRLCVFGRRRR